MSGGQATVAKRLVEALREHGSGDDDQLAALVGADRHHVNQVARALEKSGILRRAVGPDGKLVNQLVVDADIPVPARRAATVAEGLIAEDTVKRVVYAYLEDRGYTGQVAWGRQPGADIDVTGADGRLIIEAKGEASLAPQQTNYFLGALGELVQRMSDETARYGLALPDNRQYRRLVGRLPALIWRRFGLVVYFVNAAGEVVTLDGPVGETGI